MISIQIDASQLQQFLATFEAKVIHAVGAGLYQGAEMVMEESKKQVPVRTGALKASGRVNPPLYNGSQWQVDLGYGDSATQYAWLVHENMGAWHAKGTKAKYLSDPFNAMTPAVLNHLLAVVAKALTT